MKIFLISFQIIIFQITRTNQCYFSALDFKNNTFTTLKNFNNFNELNFKNCSETTLFGLKIIPNKRIILDNSLNFNQIKFRVIYNPFSIYLNNIKGIDLESNPFGNIKVLNKYKQKVETFYFLFYSDFDFYYQNKLIDQESCNEKLLSIENNFLSNIYSFDASRSHISFKNQVCLLVFHKAVILFLHLLSTNSFLIKNSLSFTNVSENLTENFNPFIAFLELKVYQCDLGLNLLNKHVFKDLEYLVLNGIINQIDDDLFKSFTNLKMLTIKTHSIKRIFQQKNKWIQYLNYKVDLLLFKQNINTVSVENLFALIIEQTHPNLTLYNFPDEDFCYFKSFPHYKLVVPLLKPIKVLKKTCLLKFLNQNSKYTESILKWHQNLPQTYYTQYYYYEEMNSYLVLKTIDVECLEFIRRTLIYCNTTEAVVKNEVFNFYFYTFEWVLWIKINKFIFSAILIPLFSLICIIINFCIVLILSLKKIKETKLYRLLKYHSIFVIFYSFIGFCRIFYLCFGTSNWDYSYFGFENCFINSDSILGRLINTIFIKTLVNSINTCSNILFALFTVSRYVSITNSKNSISKFFINISFIKKLFSSICCALLINSYSYFQFTTYSIDNYDLNSDFIDISYMKSNADKFISNFNNINDYSQNIDESDFVFLKVLNVIKILFSDLFFVLFGLGTDFLLFLFIKNKNSNTKLHVSFVSLQKIVKKKRKIRESQQRLSGMIILNGVNFMILRTPFLIISFYGFVFRYDSKNGIHYPNVYSYFICRTEGLCNVIIDVSFFIYLNSFIVQFLIFLKLDKNFKECFNVLLRKKA